MFLKVLWEPRIYFVLFAFFSTIFIITIFIKIFTITIIIIILSYYYSNGVKKGFLVKRNIKLQKFRVFYK